MSHSLSPASLIPFLLGIVLTLFGLPAGALSPVGGYRGASIAGGGHHTVASKSDGTVWAWGWNQFGQLGDGTTTDRATPVQVTGLSGVAAAIAAGARFTVALKSDGTVWAWGDNEFGQLGDGTTTNRVNPAQVTGLSGVAAIAGGSSHTVALKSDGTVWAWGDNFDSQLGDGTTTRRTAPVQATGLSGVAAIAGGSSHTVALKSDGTVWAWGWNQFGQLGDGTTTNRVNPVQVTGLSGVAAIATGARFTVALKSDGTVWAWGDNFDGQLGDGTTTRRTTPVQVTGLSGVAAIAAGGWNTMALKSDGAVWAWGGNYFGQLGDGTTTNRAIPVQVTGLSSVAAIAAGDHTVALKSDGTVWAWGGNFDGQLGDGTTTNRAIPIQVLGPGGSGYLNLLSTTPPPNNSPSSRATNLSISQSSPGRYRLLGTLVDANGQPACGLALASGRCVFSCGPGSLRCEGGVDSLPLGQFDLTDLPTEADGTLTLQTFVFGSPPGRQVVRSDGTAQLVGGATSPASSRATNPSASEVSSGRYRLTGALVDANGQPACGLALASGRCMFSCGPGSLRCEGGTSNLPLGQFDLTDLPTEADGTLTLQTFVFGSLPGRQSQVTTGGGGGCSYAINPTSRTFDYLGGAGTVTVSAPAGCAWTAQSHDDWITVTAGASGSGPGTVTYTVAVNASGAKRTGILTVAGQTHAISQTAKEDGGGGGGK